MSGRKQRDRSRPYDVYIPITLTSQKKWPRGMYLGLDSHVATYSQGRTASGPKRIGLGLGPPAAFLI